MISSNCNLSCLLYFFLTGDHGGDSDAEVTAAMFVYSPRCLLSKEIFPHSDTVNQVDLVPTLSTILGLPIPYANLGTVILQVLPSLNEGENILSDWKFALSTLWKNARQAMEYIRQYSKRTNQFSQEKLSLLQTSYMLLKENVKSVSSLEDFVNFSLHVKGYLSLVRQMCEEVWVQFDTILMYNGLLLTFATVFFIFLLVDGIPGDQLREILSGTFQYIMFGCLLFAAFGIFICYLINLVDYVEISIYFSSGILSMIVIAVVIIRSWAAISNHWKNQIKSSDWPSVIGRVLLLLSLCGLFSNSYVVEEARVLSYFLLTMAWFLVYCFKPSKPEPAGRVKTSEKQLTSWYNKTSLTQLKLKLFMFVTLLSVLVRLSQYYWLCREEQMDCESFATHKAHSFASLVNMRYCNSQCLFTMICLALFATIARIWLRSCGNLVGFSLTVTLARYGPTIVVVCTGGFWVLQSLPNDTKYKLFLPLQIQFLPWIAYGFICVSLLTALFQPLSIYVVPKMKESLTFPVYGQTNIIPHLFNQMKELMRGQRKSDVSGDDGSAGEDVPIVYGLATVYSSVFVNICVFVCLLIALLLGDALAPSVVLMCTTSTVLLTILSAIQYEKALCTGERASELVY
jgi:phosphatidylinositol glycan class O